MSVGNTLERALQRISREDVVFKCIHEVKAVIDEDEKEVARKELGIDHEQGRQFLLVSTIECVLSVIKLNKENGVLL